MEEKKTRFNFYSFRDMACHGEPTATMESEFEEYIHTKVPLTGTLRLGVRRATTDEVVLTLPLRGNANDKGTLFAGASASGLTFCCWALAELVRAARHAHARRSSCAGSPRHTAAPSPSPSPRRPTSST